MATRVTLNELCDKMGVGYVLGPYQTHPWSCYNSDTGATCSAEVRMSPDGSEVEAEAQMMYDVPPEGHQPMEQICAIRATMYRDGTWSVVGLRIKGEAYGQDIHDWEGKSCVFFSMLVSRLQADEIPDIDDLIEEAFHDRERFGDNRQGGGGKAPKAKAGALMGMKKGGGGF